MTFIDIEQERQSHPVDVIEQIAALNDWTGQGWTFESLHFAMRESSKRPSMAFLSFTRDEPD